jgi:hypothetical protein
MRPPSIPARDPVAVGLVVFFVACNVAVDAAGPLLDGRTLAGPCRLLAAAGWGACGPGTPVDLAREALNGWVTQLLELWLLAALLLRRPERHALQLAVGSYVVYAVVIDAWLGVVAALYGMPPSVIASVPSIVVAAVRLIGHLYLVVAATRAIVPWFRRDAVAVETMAPDAVQLRSGA